MSEQAHHPAIPPSSGSNVPNPGSDAATEQGCTCPVSDNHHGQGVPNSGGGRIFWFTAGCPVHDVKGVPV